MTHSHFYRELVHTIKLELRMLKDDLRYIEDKRKKGDRVVEFLERLEDKLDTNGKIAKEGREITS